MEYNLPLVEKYRPNNLNSIVFYRDDVQRGIRLSSSISLDREIWNGLLEFDWSVVRSKDHNIQFDPAVAINAIFNIDLPKGFHLNSNWSFISKRNAIAMQQIYALNGAAHSVDHENIDYVSLESHLISNVALNYEFKSMIFSIDFENILGHKIDLYHHYYDDNGFKFRVGFLYKI